MATDTKTKKTNEKTNENTSEPAETVKAKNQSAGYEKALYFTENYFNGGELPAIVENSPITDLADVFAASGLFGELTPAQIAVQILAGRELGFGAVASMFNLKIEPGKISLAGSQPPFLVLEDSLDFHRLIIGEKLTERNKKADQPPASGYCPVCGLSKSLSSVVTNEAGEKVMVCSAACARVIIDRKQSVNKDDLSRPNSEKDQTPAPNEETRESAAIWAAASNPFGSLATINPNDLQICPICYEQKPLIENFIVPGADGAADLPVSVCSPSCAQTGREKYVENIENAEKVGMSSFAESLANLADDPNEPILKKYLTEKDDEKAAKQAAAKPADEFAAIDESAERAKNEAAAKWRGSIEKMCNELKLPTKEKLNKFDGLPYIKQAEMFATVKKYYTEQLDKLLRRIEFAFKSAAWKATKHIPKDWLALQGLPRLEEMSYEQAEKAIVALKTEDVNA